MNPTRLPRPAWRPLRGQAYALTPGLPPPILDSMPVSGSAHIVLVEDDPAQRLLLTRWLELAGWTVTPFEDAESCFDQIDALLPDVVCLDLHLPGMDGHEALRRIKAQYPQVPVLVITGDSDVETVVETMRLGGHDFLVKPVDRARLETQVKNAIAHAQLSLRVAHLEREAGRVSYPGIIGTSAPMRQLYRQIDRIAASPVTVLVRGESGTGKELVARTIHHHSPHSSGPLVAINCAAIPESLQESELFGHERGAFTGADRRKIGRFEEVDGGTLFLDEVAELSASLQAKLLRVLQERTFRRVGGDRDLSTRFRLIAASHADLHARVAEGKFREDLLYRLAVFELDVPPLRERVDDVPALASHFLSDRGLMGDGVEPSLTAEALEVLMGYPWPGNVRELANAMQRAAVVATGGRIGPGDLPPRIRRTVGARPTSGALAPVDSRGPGQHTAAEPVSVAGPSASFPALGSSALGSSALGPPEPGRRERPRSEPPGSPMPLQAAAPPNSDPSTVGGATLESFLDAGPSLREIEALAIGRAIERHRENLSAVARELGIGRNTLYRKIEKYGLGQAPELLEAGDGKKP